MGAESCVRGIGYLAAPALVGVLAHAANLPPALLVPLVLVVGVLPLAWSTGP